MRYILINVFFFFKNQSSVVYFLLKLLIQFLDKNLIYILLIITIVIYIFLMQNLIKFKKDKNLCFYFSKSYQVFFSIIVVITFISYYIVYLRLLSFFSTRIINIYFIKNVLLRFVHEYTHYNLLLVSIFLISLIIMIIIVITNIYICNFSKKHLLKLYYYYFFRQRFLIKSIQFFSKIEIKIATFLGKKYFFFNVLRFYGLRVVVVLYFLKNIVFDGGDINLILMPYYGMYYFIFNIYIFLVFKLKEDFDILIAEKYFKKIYFFMDRDENIKNEYKNFLLYDLKDFLFKDCINICNIHEIEENVFFINTYKYSINRYPNDFFTRIKSIKPQFIEEKKQNWRY